MSDYATTFATLPLDAVLAAMELPTPGRPIVLGPELVPVAG